MHRNRSGRRTNEVTEIAPDAFGFVNDRKAFIVNHLEINALMSAVFASDMTQITLNAVFGINARDGFIF